MELLLDINNNIIPQIQTLNIKITQIITPREVKINPIIKDNNKKFEPLKFDHLPSVMISSMSSFSTFDDVLNLGKSTE